MASWSIASAASHDVALTVRQDCQAVDSSRQLLVSESSAVHFDVYCFGFGTLKVSTQSLGASPYGHGHYLELAVGEPAVPLIPNDTTSARVVAGQYQPTFRPAPNCTTSTAAGLVDVYPDVTTRLQLQATCDPAGTLRISLSPTGMNFPNSILWDAVEASTGAVEHLRILAGVETDVMLSPGDWTGSVVAIPENCEVTSTDPVDFSIAAEQTAQITVAIHCAPYRGTLRVTLVAPADVGSIWLNLNGSCSTVYALLADFCTALVPNGSVTLSLFPGTYSVHAISFSGTDTCQVIPPEPIIAEVRLLMITDVTFAAACL